MDTVAGNFVASRQELLGDAALLGAAERARHVCGGAERAVSVLAVAGNRMQRVDAWSDAEAVATLGVSARPTDRRAGSLCARDRAHELANTLMTTLVDELPTEPAGGAVDLGPLGALSPTSLPRSIAWVIVVAAYPASPRAALTALAATDGLAMAHAADLRSPVILEPLSRAAAVTMIADLLVPPSGPD